MEHANWEDLRILMKVVRAGTFRAAALTTGLSPATLSRRIDDLERSLGEKLLERFQTGCVPTAAGESAVSWIAQMEEISFEIERMRDQRDAASTAGTVRINTDEWMSYFLTTRFAPFRELYPNLEIEIVTTHRPYSLARREADIAIRPFRPDQEDLVARRVGTLSYGLYCNRDYRQRHAARIAAGDWAALDYIGFDEPRAEFRTDRWLRGLAGGRAPWMRCSYGIGIFDGVIHGAGLGVLATFLAGESAALDVVIPHIPELDQEVWLSMHQGLRSSARVRAVTEFVAGLFDGERARPD
ncbi:LysR family transcriptional regulator [Poseidonocella sp. HB161398]|uniref:LysR family transcriptional regulator n=1 Tax=Poseidonocella sp. HB161398 TaxID=2320855 RepID=UPI001485FF71|nr:LysR family transcriptional regulator [Poseidonocella sp. HB161398]